MKQNPSVLIIVFLIVTPISATNFGVSDSLTRAMKVVFWAVCTISLLVITYRRNGYIQPPKVYCLWLFLSWLITTAVMGGSYYGVLLVFVLVSYLVLVVNVYRKSMSHASASMCRDVLIAYSILTGVNLIASISPSAYAISDTGVRLSGIVGQPSQASQLAGIVIVCACFISMRIVMKLSLILMAGAVMYLAGGRTILLSLLMALFVVTCVRRRGAKFIAFMLIGAGIAFPFVVTELSTMLQHGASDMLWLARTGNVREIYTLSGRTPLWSAVITSCLHNPFFGVGFGVAKEQLPNLYATSWGWSTDSAHNAYLHIIYETGFIGLTLAVIAIGITVYKVRLKVEWAMIIFIITESVMSSTFAGPGVSPLALILFSILAMSKASNYNQQEAFLHQGATSR